MKVGDAVRLDRWHAPRLSTWLGIDADAVGVIVNRRTYTKPDGNPDGDFTRHTKFQVLFSIEPRWLDRYELEVVNEGE